MCLVPELVIRGTPTGSEYLINIHCLTQIVFDINCPALYRPEAVKTLSFLMTKDIKIPQKSYLQNNFSANFTETEKNRTNQAGVRKSEIERLKPGLHFYISLLAAVPPGVVGTGWVIFTSDNVPGWSPGSWWPTV